MTSGGGGGDSRIGNSRIGNRRIGKWGVRLLALLGVALIVLSATGWWLSTRVLSADGFADVAAKASHRQEVRDYIADQATLRLAKSSNFVSAARPVVTNAISAAIDTAPVTEAVHEFIGRAHEQIFRANDARRVNVDSAQAAVTVRTALETINPQLAKKLPLSVLSASTTVSQSATVDTLFRATRWVRALFIPVFLAGVGVFVFVALRARDRVHALRVIGIVLAVAGALMIGVGVASPAVAAVASTNAPGRGDAVAAFVDVLVGRLVGAGKAFAVFGVLLALAPGHDGGDLRSRVERMRAWVARKRLQPRWRFAGGAAIFVVAALVLAVPAALFRSAYTFGALLALYVGIVVCLRASGLLVTDHSIQPLHKRQVFGVFAVMIVAMFATASIAVALVANGTDPPRANPTNQGCNGYIELCAQRLDAIVWPASHNSMSSAAYNFLGAEHTITIPEQLNAGARFFMIDAYYGYDDKGLVRTNLAGGIDRGELRAERGADAVHELDRLGALTGVADTSGTKQEVYFCHDFCELGAVTASEVFAGVAAFLDQNLTDVVVLDVEDYVRPKDLRQALVDAGLFDRVWRPKKGAAKLPILYDMVVPTDPDAEDQPRRLIVMSEKHPDVYPWLLGTYSVSEETPFTFTSVDEFNCDPNRGGTGRDLLIVNHWLRPKGPPDPVKAGSVNSAKTLTRRLGECITVRGRIPNVVAVNFTAVGDLNATVNRYNAAIARLSGVTPEIDTAVREISRRDDLTAGELRDLEALRRLPKIKEEAARKLLGDLSDRLPIPDGLRKLVRHPPDSTPTTTTTTTTVG